MSDRVLIFGSRGWTRTGEIYDYVEALPPGTVVITGLARGVDAKARAFAAGMGLWVVDVPCLHQHWKLHGKGAGHVRNDVMLSLNPTRAVAFWDGDSPGTRSMVHKVRKAGIPLEVIT